MYTLETSNIQTRSQAGYSLLQLAIALLALGVISAPFINLYTLQQKNKQINTSYENIEFATNAIQNYRKTYGVYPCPAPLNILRSDAAYGHPVDAPSDPLSCRSAAISAIPPGSCGPSGPQSVCIETSVRAGLTNPRVVVGSLPFRLLQIEESRTVDGYGSRFVYAVTESMTDSTLFNEKNGAIAVRDDQDQTVVDPDGSAAFIIVSPGPDKVGGYSIQGTQINPCVGAGKDVENCNIGFQTTAAASPNSIYISAYQSDAAGATHYDDTVSYFSDLSEPLWRRVPNTDDIQDLSERNIGVGFTASDPSVQFDVSSKTSAITSMRVFGTSGADGKIRADQICAPDGTNCFDPAIIADNNTTGLGMKCPNPGEYMQGIANGVPVCASTNNLAIQCPASSPILTGIDASGNPICGTTPNAACPAQGVSLCAPGVNDAFLPSAPDTSTAVASAGSCRTQPYKCDGSLGQWVSTGAASGSCTFTPNALVSTTSGLACDPGYSGTFTSTVVTSSTCGGANQWSDTKWKDCFCVGSTSTQNLQCSTLLGPNYSGTVPQTTTITPNPSNPNQCITSVSTPNTSSCTCNVPAITTKTVSAGSCPSGYTGTKTQLQTFNPTTCSWQNTGPVIDSCTCNTTPILSTQNHDCSLPPYDTVCYSPNFADKDVLQQNIDPATCTPGVPSQVHTGSCSLKSFKWVQVGTNGDTAAAPGARIIGDACSCAEHQNVNSVQCFKAADSSNQIFFCRCQ